MERNEIKIQDQSEINAKINSVDSFDTAERRVTGKENKSNVKKQYKQKFKQSWKKKFPWLEMKSNRAFCKACVKFIGGGIALSRRHAVTSSHRMKINAAEKTIDIKDFLINDERQEQDRLIKSAELKITVFLQEHKLPLNLMDHLLKLIASICSDSKLAKAIMCAQKNESYELDEGIDS